MNTNHSQLERYEMNVPILGTNLSFWRGTNGNDKATDSLPHVTPSSLKGNVGEHGSVRGGRPECSKCYGRMHKEDLAMVCRACGKHEYFDNLPRDKRELAEAFRPSIKEIKYRGETPRFQNKNLQVQVLDNKYDTSEKQPNNRSLSFRYKFPCRYQRCSGDMKQGVRKAYRKKEGWKIIAFHCTKNESHQNRLYEDERGEVVNWE
jgi:hypothetical protein